MTLHIRAKVAGRYVTLHHGPAFKPCPLGAVPNANDERGI